MQKMRVSIVIESRSEVSFSKRIKDLIPSSQVVWLGYLRDAFGGQNSWNTMNSNEGTATNSEETAEFLEGD